MIRIAEAVKYARQQLHLSKTAQLDAEVLLCHILKCEVTYLYAYPEKVLTYEDKALLEKLISLRAKGIPIAYITKQKEFWSLSLHIDKHALIPRPDTEILVEAALKLIPENTVVDILDLGTGTGAIAIAIASERPLAEIDATDNSGAVLTLAKKNAKAHRINNICFIHADWFNIPTNRTYNFIVSNPPYISSSDIHLKRGDVRFEPRSALISGEDGLDDLSIIICQAKKYLNQQGWLLVEHGHEQAESVTNLFDQSGFKFVTTIKDYSDNDRVTMGKKDE